MSDRLTEIRARLDAAHDALWSSSQNTRQDAPHAVHLIADIAWLLDEVERLRAPMLTLDTRTGEITSE